LPGASRHRLRVGRVRDVSAEPDTAFDHGFGDLFDGQVLDLCAFVHQRERFSERAGCLHRDHALGLIDGEAVLQAGKFLSQRRSPFRSCPCPSRAVATDVLVITTTPIWRRDRRTCERAAGVLDTFFTRVRRRQRVCLVVGTGPRELPGRRLRPAALHADQSLPNHALVRLDRCVHCEDHPIRAIARRPVRMRLLQGDP